MSYLSELKTILETTLAGDGNTFGSNSISDHGGSFGNNDFYATGDARNLWGSKKRSKKKKSSKKMKFPLYRRTPISEDVDINLDCMIITQSLEQVKLVEEVLREYNIIPVIDHTNIDCIVIEFNEKESSINKIIESNKWDTTKCLCFLGEMV
jgi:hypothetical protein